MRRPLIVILAVASVTAALLQAQNAPPASWRIGAAPADLHDAVSRADLVVASLHDALQRELAAGSW